MENILIKQNRIETDRTNILFEGVYPLLGYVWIDETE